MTPLRAKYIRDLTIRGRAQRTQRAYTRYVSELARYYQRSPELISYEEVTNWLYHLCQTQSYLRIGQRYLRMTQNPLWLHVVCCRIDGAAPQDNCVLQLRWPLRSNCFLAVLFDGVADAKVQESSSSSHRRRCTLTTPSLKPPLRSALNILWYSPQRLSEPRGWAVIKPDDLRSGNHHRIGITVLFHGNQEGSGRRLARRHRNR